MMGSFITRGLIMAFGYAYPAYECFKIVERTRPDVEYLLFWCQYWIIIAVMTVLERWADILISWVPFYSEAKLAFVIYLWYPKTMGTTYVYSTLLRPLLVRHESDIDQNLNELRLRAGDVALLWWQRGFIYVQARFYELLQFLAAQPTRPPPQAYFRSPLRDLAQGGSATYPPPGSGAGFPPDTHAHQHHDAPAMMHQQQQQQQQPPYPPPHSQGGMYPPPPRRPYGRALSDDDNVDYAVEDDESKRARFRSRERSGQNSSIQPQNDSPWNLSPWLPSWLGVAQSDKVD